ERLLSVPASLLREKGAVSREVASAMAEGIRCGEAVDLGLAVTGIAGPSGGSVQKPVGQVYIALSDSVETRSFPFHFQGDRESIQSEAAQMALETVRQYLLGIRRQRRVARMHRTKTVKGA
ncbi:MAG: CinA family protein, partial [Nitrospiria bacterium]